jgi:xylulokinase
MSEYFMGIDVGTTETKAVLFKSEGTAICKSSLELSLQITNQYFIEQDYDDVWKKTSLVIKETIKKSEVDPRKIAFISVTGQRETLSALDKNKKILRKGISWQDCRGRDFCKIMKDKVGDEKIRKITGLPVNTMPWANKIMWLKEKESRLYEKTWKFLGIVDYIVFKLTNILITDYSNASRTQLFDINTKKWSDELFDALGLDKEKMPDVKPSGTLISNVQSKAYVETGLSDQTVVIYAGGDQQCTALGAGVISVGRVSCILGTSTNMEMYTEKIPHDLRKPFEVVIHVVPNAYLLEGGIGTTGVIYRWFRDEFASAEKVLAHSLGKDTYVVLDEEATKSPPGSLGLMLIPYFAGSEYPYWNPEDRGAIIGFTLSHKKAHVIRAILEGVAYEYRRMLEDGIKVLRTPISEIRFSGGGAKSRLWTQIFADVLGLPGQVTEIYDTGALGAGILGTVAFGWYNDVKKATSDLVRIKETVNPNKESHMLYSKLYYVYRQMYGRIQDLVNKISKIYEE